MWEGVASKGGVEREEKRGRGKGRGGVGRGLVCPSTRRTPTGYESHTQDSICNVFYCPRGATAHAIRVRNHYSFQTPLILSIFSREKS